jgi:hypothetical protein
MPLRRLLRLAAIFLLPPYLALAVIEWRAPPEWSTFRCWEALLVEVDFGVLPGPFYPGQQVARTEVGDLAAHTGDRIQKQVEWITDRHGYRTREHAGPPRVVLIGDSMSVGSASTQRDTLAEALERALGCRVYPFAPGQPGAFLDEPRFTADPPEVVILQRIERDTELRLERSWTRSHRPSLPLLHGLAIAADRAFTKRALQHQVRSVLRRTLDPAPAFPRGAPGQDGRPMYFRDGAAANEAAREGMIEALVAQVAAFECELAARGIRLIYLPVPNKESIYPDRLPVPSPTPRFVPHLVERLAREQIAALDTQKVLSTRRKAEPTTLLYHSDDSHWNREGIAAVAGALALLVRDALDH